ncbi:MAG TPA: serine/threonine-protein kinase [Candidatus Krumholzibacteria bacterium]|nr:serine/threonine-protein kinase [Candidatus Krumholzibacteria bacterium]
MTDDTPTLAGPDDDPDRTLAGGDPDRTVVSGGSAGAASGEPADESQVIGPYRLVEPIGEGGMGQVFKAEQTAPIRRTVALKVVKRGMDTEEFVARFASERQALALMDHPCIAKVFDAGATPRGRPYFVMEYVDGVPLTDYCDAKRLSLRQRIELFIHVCEGVQHAHQKAIIHRDLKPSNVLVAEVDGQPLPKIIDFGVAKAIDRDLTENTLRTGMGQLVGTPAYMSPEQADFAAHDVDTRADVYALGVILYELMAGVRPFPPEKLEKAGFKEAMRIIREVDPPRPSDRFTTLAGERDTLAHARGVEAPVLRRRLAGDLDWIAMKALEKDRQRRYSTALGLALDLRRHLNHEPVSAGPPTASYRVGKFVRRHRTGVVAGAIVAVALVLGALGTTVGMIRAVRAEKVARDEATTATRVTDFLVDLFEVSDPEHARGETITAREILDQGAGRIESELADQPQVRARLMATVGRVYRNLGLYEAARPYLEEALRLRRAEGGGPELAASLTDLADLYRNLARYDEATALLRESLQDMHGRGAPDKLKLADSMGELAAVYRRQGRYDEARPLYEQARELRAAAVGPDDPLVAASDNSLAALAWNRGDYAEAEARFKHALTIWENAYGENHADVAKGLNNLALLYHQLKRYGEAEPLYLRAIPIYEKVLGPGHARLGQALNNLGLLYCDEKAYAKAEPYLRRALAIRRAALGADHPDVAQTLNNLGNLSREEGRYAAADSLLHQALDIRRRTFGEAHPDVAWSERDLGLLADARGDTAAALQWFRQAIGVFSAANGADHPELAGILDDYAAALRHAGRPNEATDIQARADRIRPAEEAKDIQ